MDRKMVKEVLDRVSLALTVVFLSVTGSLAIEPKEYFRKGEDVIKSGTGFVSQVFAVLFFVIYWAVLVYSIVHGWKSASEEIQRSQGMQQNKLFVYAKHILPAFFVAGLLVVVGSYFIGLLTNGKLTFWYLNGKFFKFGQ